MSSRTLTTKKLADRQRRAARLANWRAFPPEQQNLVIRRLADQRTLRKANANAVKIATEAGGVAVTPVADETVTQETTDATD